MSKVPIPQEDNTVQSLALALSKSIISQVPIAGNLINEFIEKSNQKLIEKGHKIFLKEVEKGTIDLSDYEKEAFIPIGHRYYLAAQDGTVKRNLQLLAKLIRKQIDDHDLSYEKYTTLDNAFRYLSLEELVVLSEFCKQIGSDDKHQFGYKPGYRTITIEDYGNPDFTALVTNLMEQYPDTFKSELSVHSTFSLLSGKGLALPISEATLSGDYMKFRPSNMVIGLKDIVAEIELDPAF